MLILGIDISKAKVDVAFLNASKAHSKQFENTLQGFTQLNLWIKKYSANKVLACMESTGVYGLALAEFLYAQGYDVSIINPICIKSYARCQLTRHKTDKIDATIIAEYASKQNLPLWKPTNPSLKEIRELYRCSQALKQQFNQAKNHLENKNLPESVKQIWLSLLSELKQKIKSVELKARDHFR